MKSREWISTKTVAIATVVFLLFIIGFHFYMRHDMKKFEATLPKVATTDTSISPVASNPESTEAVLSDEETPQNSAETEPSAPKDENQLSACAMAAMEMSKMNSAEQSEDEQSVKLYAGLTEDEARQLWDDLSSPYITNADEKFDLLGDVLIDKLGPDPRIPEYIRGLKTAHVLQQMELSRTNSEEDVDNYMSYLPAVFANSFVELTIELFELSPKKASEMRDLVKQVESEVDTLKLLQETRPWVQNAIDAGDLSPEEGELVIESVTGLEVTMPGEDRTASVEYSRIRAEDFTVPQEVTSPESVHSNVPELSGD